MSTTREASAGPLVLAVTRTLLVVTAVIALITGPTLWINGLTVAGGPVDVPVRYTAAAQTSASTRFDATLDDVRLSVPPAVTDSDGGAPTGVSLTVDDDAWTWWRGTPPTTSRC